METHKVEDVNRGLYTVDGSLDTRKDLQLVKSNVTKAPTKTKAQQNNVIYRITKINHYIIQK
jgi:hypothetical protein